MKSKNRSGGIFGKNPLLAALAVAVLAVSVNTITPGNAEAGYSWKLLSTKKGACQPYSFGKMCSVTKHYRLNIPACRTGTYSSNYGNTKWKVYVKAVGWMQCNRMVTKYVYQ